ncbi:cytochrome P450 [Auricularia subglabra TFB-10046 SS5]|uniref:Cytochrome P450 n=1 Tax=Auricularia subglabra (strain TFB-10046 / SS5) TaxID=717982 RepID=J0DD01_AURST|nr:cytochrome P450 [Auricularia subglabra TFB-10046 SS5]
MLVLFVSTVTIGVATYWAVTTYRTFQRNRQAAIASGLPYICLPVNTFSPSWQVLGPAVVPVCRMLPFGLGAWADDARPAWILKHELHRKYGPVFMIVSPWSNVVHVVDPDVLLDVVARRTEFPKPSEFYKIVEVYGRNVVTTDGSEWVRYRKITGPPFSEKNNHLVWTSALEQVSQLIAGMTSLSPSPKTSSNSTGWVLSHLQRDMKTIALHVISAAAFGVHLPFLAADAGSQVPDSVWTHQEFDDFGPKPAPGHALTFAQSIHTLLRYLIPVMVIPKALLRAVPIPAWRSAYAAYSEFRDYILLLAQRSKGITQASSEHENLLRALVSRNSDEAVGDRLSDDEVLAHMFVFVLAGHETTANALSYAIINLALQQDAQAWFLEQLDEQLAACNAGPVQDWDYSAIFGNLPAVICLMNETLRLYPTVAGVPKWSADASVALHWDGRKCVVPPKTPIVFNTIALHRSPALWGEDVSQFRPQRWMEKQPRKGQFMAFSEGARACLGKKFAQVEFVAVITALFARYRVEIDCGPRESPAAARKHATAVLDSSVVLATLGMNREIPVRFVERK